MEISRRISNNCLVTLEQLDRQKLSGFMISRLYRITRIDKSRIPIGSILDIAGLLYSSVVKVSNSTA